MKQEGAAGPLSKLLPKPHLGTDANCEEKLRKKSGAEVVESVSTPTLKRRRRKEECRPPCRKPRLGAEPAEEKKRLRPKRVASNDELNEQGFSLTRKMHSAEVSAEALHVGTEVLELKKKRRREEKRRADARAEA